ncbi:MAG TPA: hypothetical protein EYP67_04840 [Methanosarcinales archaeon]|nr:hypothetical protein [Methanosarcinales archaeon]
MKSILPIAVLIVAIAASACIIPDDSNTETPTPTATATPETPPAIADMIPGGDLPESLALRAVIDVNTEGTVDIIKEAASMVSGSLGVGEITDAVQGVYSAEGEYTDVTVTVIECADSVNAANAARNYKNQPKFENPPARTVSRFAKVNFNGHEATEVRTRPPIEDGDIRYGYVWSNGNYVFIVEPGTSDKSTSMELARMTGY